MSQEQRDLSWVCVFCKRPPHFGGLGDLFGPYFIKGEEAPTTSTNNKNSKGADSPTKKSPGKSPKGGDDPVESKQEIWFHEDCISWSSGVYLIGNKIMNIEDSVRDSFNSICSTCGLNGANLGCISTGCQIRYHFICGKNACCLFNEDNFSIFCPKHKTSVPSTSSENNEQL